jgi:hypothetical protein
MADDFTLTPIDHDPFDLSEPADLSHRAGAVMLPKPSVRTRKYRIREPGSPRPAPGRELVRLRM